MVGIRHLETPVSFTLPPVTLTVKFKPLVTDIY
jgi:hypothetical protein